MRDDDAIEVEAWVVDETPPPRPKPEPILDKVTAVATVVGYIVLGLAAMGAFVWLTQPLIHWLAEIA